MYNVSRGIVFRQIKYADSSLVVRVLTEGSGLVSFIIKGARGPKAKIRASLFQPLTLLELMYSQHGKGDLHHIREARIAYPYRTIPQDIRKSCILLFLNELLNKSIQEETANPSLFAFIFDHLVMLDETNENPSNFHLLFATQLTRYLGFFPHGNYRDDDSVFDLSEGIFGKTEPLPASHFITGQLCFMFSRLLTVPVSDFYRLSFPAGIRHDLLEKLLRYYQFHLPLPGEFKSHLVLHEVLQK